MDYHDYCDYSRVLRKPTYNLSSNQKKVSAGRIRIKNLRSTYGIFPNTEIYHKSREDIITELFAAKKSMKEMEIVISNLKADNHRIEIDMIKQDQVIEEILSKNVHLRMGQNTEDWLRELEKMSMVRKLKHYARELKNTLQQREMEIEELRSVNKIAKVVELTIENQEYIMEIERLHAYIQSLHKTLQQEQDRIHDLTHAPSSSHIPVHYTKSTKLYNKYVQSQLARQCCPAQKMGHRELNGDNEEMEAFIHRGSDKEPIFSYKQHNDDSKSVSSTGTNRSKSSVAPAKSTASREALPKRSKPPVNGVAELATSYNINVEPSAAIIATQSSPNRRQRQLTTQTSVVAVEVDFGMNGKKDSKEKYESPRDRTNGHKVDHSTLPVTEFEKLPILKSGSDTKERILSTVDEFDHKDVSKPSHELAVNKNQSRSSTKDGDNTTSASDCVKISTIGASTELQPRYNSNIVNASSIADDDKDVCVVPTKLPSSSPTKLSAAFLEEVKETVHKNILKWKENNGVLKSSAKSILFATRTDRGHNPDLAEVSTLSNKLIDASKPLQATEFVNNHDIQSDFTVGATEDLSTAQMLSLLPAARHGDESSVKLHHTSPAAQRIIESESHAPPVEVVRRRSIVPALEALIEKEESFDTSMSDESNTSNNPESISSNKCTNEALPDKNRLTEQSESDGCRDYDNDSFTSSGPALSDSLDGGKPVYDDIFEANTVVNTKYNAHSSKMPIGTTQLKSDGSELKKGRKLNFVVDADVVEVPEVCELSPDGISGVPLNVHESLAKLQEEKKKREASANAEQSDNFLAAYLDQLSDYDEQIENVDVKVGVSEAIELVEELPVKMTRNEGTLSDDEINDHKTSSAHSLKRFESKEDDCGNGTEKVRILAEKTKEKERESSEHSEESGKNIQSLITRTRSNVEVSEYYEDFD